MSTIAADPLALMPRGEAVAGSVAAPAAGDGADFALALADVMAAGATPALPGETAVDGLPGEADAPLPQAGDGAAIPLKMLEGLGRIVLPSVPVPGGPAAGSADAVPLAETGDIATVLPVEAGSGSGLGMGMDMGEVAEPAAVLPAAVPTVDPARVEAMADEPVAAEAAEVAGPALPPAVAAQAAAEGEVVPVEEGEVPLAEVAEAVSEAVAVVIAAPLAVAAGKAVADAPMQDAAAEAVRLAGAAPLMAPHVKGKKAEVATLDKGQPKGDGDGEGVKSAGDGKDKTVESKVTARVAQIMPEAAAKPVPDKRAEPAAPVADALRGAETATGATPQMQATPSVTAQPAATAPVAMDRPGWEAALTERIAAELSEDGQQIELDLSPERLGGLKIMLEISDGQAQVRFVTETPEAARLIQQNEHRLSESLSRAGLSLGGHESASRDAQQQQGDRSGRGGPRGAEIAFQRPAEPRPGMISGRAGSGLVNLIA